MQKQEWTGSTADIANNIGGLYEGNLRHYLKVVFEAPNVHNGYHGFRHMTHVTWVVYMACVYYKDRLTERQMRNLLIAALFHDYDHTGVKGPDAVNIARAIAALWIHILPEDVLYIHEITAIMEVTMYPHEGDAENFTLEQRIMRDADMSQAFEPAWIGEIVFGYGSELGIPPVQMLQNQLAFLEDLHFLTSFGEEKYGEQAISAKRAETYELLHILQ